MKNKPNGYVPSDPAMLRAVPKACADEREAVLFLEGLRWNGKPFCPRSECGSFDVYAMKDRKTGERERHYRLRCRRCRKQFSVRTGTPMEGTNLPLTAWLTALWMQVTSKKGVPALQVARMTGVSYKWALFLCHRVRHAVTDTEGARKLSGDIEADEAYIGGKSRRGNFDANYKFSPKIPVVAVLERGGEVRAQVMCDEPMNMKSVQSFMIAETSEDSRLSTDESSLYRGLGYHYKGKHHRVNHRYFEWVRWPSRDSSFAVTTNTVEGFWGLLKKRIGATHHSVSLRHMHRYVSEACFLWNTRHFSDGDRLRMAVIRGEGKRLYYRRHVAA
jgi:transposase-like protein